MKKFIKYIAFKVEKAFLWSSGADLNVLYQVPIEKPKFLGIGGTILFTALMASFAGGYAFFTAFKNIPLSIFFGLFWGSLIFNLDRYIVSTFGVGDGKKTISRQEIYEATPRLIMALILGIVISTPLELKIFEKEINVKLEQLKISKKEALIHEDKSFEKDLTDKKALLVKTNSEIKSLNENKSNLVDRSVEFLENHKKELEKDWAQKNSVVQSEDASQTSALNYYYRLKNDTTKSKSQVNTAYQNFSYHHNNYLNAITLRTDVENQINKLQTDKQKALVDEMNRLNSEITRLTNQANDLTQKINQLDVTDSQKKRSYDNTVMNYDGFAAHMEAMDEVSDERFILRVVRWLITLLFIFIEIAPVLFKMMTERGPYDDIMDRMKHEVRVKQLQLQSNMNMEINTEVRIHTDKFEQKLNAELQANKDLLQTISKAQLEIAQVAIESWKEEQLKKMRENPGLIINRDSNS